jgi:hypothetical protein
VDGLNVSEFVERLALTCSTSSSVAALIVTGEGVTWTRLRIALIDASFVDVFYNEVSGKAAYAWIRDGNRVLGADNTGGWHWHPFEKPETHRPVEAEVTFGAFLSEIERHLS